MKRFFIFLIVFLIANNSSFAKIENKIIAKIGDKIITNFDIRNEINTILAISNKNINNEDINILRNLAFVSLKKQMIRKTEIEKYKINSYNKKDLDSYVLNLEKNLSLPSSLKDHFKKYNANYESFIRKLVVDIKWNNLIYSLYKKQLDVDELLIKAELQKEISEKREIIEFNLSEIVIEKPKETLIQEIYASINKDGFEKTASLRSNSLSAPKGGKIGWVSSSSISNLYLSKIQKLKPGQITPPINNINNTVIIKLNDKRITKSNNLDLVKIENNIIKKKKEEKLNVFSNAHYLNLEKLTFIEINE